VALVETVSASEAGRSRERVPRVSSVFATPARHRFLVEIDGPRHGGDAFAPDHDSLDEIELELATIGVTRTHPISVNCSMMTLRPER
jgi:hypothetical protein